MSDTSSASCNDTGKFSPFAGCSIFIIAGTMAACMIGLTIWTYFKVKDTIAGFTEEASKPIELVEIKGKESMQVKLKEKLIGFRYNIENQHKAELVLDASEMNLAIATFDILKPHRKNLFITTIGNGAIEADISFPIKSKMGSEEMRYLNASITIKPELVEGAAFPRITEIKPDKGNTVPEEFEKFISETLLKPLHEDKELGPFFNSLSEVEIRDDMLVLHTDSSHVSGKVLPKGTQPMFKRFMTGFAIIAVIFLTIVALVIFLSRRKAKQS